MKKLLYIAIAALLAIYSCDNRPDEILSRGKMEDVLYDYHLAQGAIEMLPDSERESKAQDYINSVYSKHEITEAQFDTSVIYYNRKTEDLAKIYDNLKKRLGEASEAIHLQTGSNDMTAIFADGDTANIWTAPKTLLLRPKEMLCTESFSILADTAFYRHDQFIMTFSPVFVKEQSEKRDMTFHAGLSVVYKNGKTVSTTRQSAYTETMQLSVTASDDEDIDKVTGFFYYNGNNSIRNFCVIDNISLIRMHAKKQEEATDSVTATEQKESLLKVDTLHTDTVMLPQHRLTPDEARRENQSGTKIKIQKAPSVRTPNSYGPRRRNNAQPRRMNERR